MWPSMIFVIVVIIVGAIKLYRLPGRHELTDLDILTAVGFDGKTIPQIQKFILDTYSTKDGPPLPYYRASALHAKLTEFEEMEAISSEVIEGHPEKYIHDKVLYRRRSEYGRLNKAKGSFQTQPAALVPLPALQSASFFVLNFYLDLGFILTKFYCC